MAEVKRRTLAGPVFSRNDRRRREARCSLPRVAVESSSSAGSLVRNSLGDLFSQQILPNFAGRGVRQRVDDLPPLGIFLICEF